MKPAYALALALVVTALLAAPAAAATHRTTNQWYGFHPTYTAVSPVYRWDLLYNASILEITPESMDTFVYLYNTTAPAFTGTETASVDYYTNDTAYAVKVASVDWTAVMMGCNSASWCLVPLSGEFTYWDAGYFNNLNSECYDYIGCHNLHPVVRYDNISEGVHSFGPLVANSGVDDGWANATHAVEDTGIVMITHTDGPPFFSHSYGPITPTTPGRYWSTWTTGATTPGAENCSVAAEVRDLKTGALIGGSQVSAWSSDTIWNTTTLAFTYGSGTVDIPLTEFSNTLNVEGMASGYSSSGWTYPPDTLDCSSTIRIYLNEAKIEGKDCDLTFAVYQGPESNLTLLAIPGATVALTNLTSWGISGATNEAGTVTFNVNSTMLLNYTASKDGYSPFKSSTSCDGWTEGYEMVFLNPGAQPTATVPTVTAGPGEDTTLDAIEFIKANAYFLVVLFFLVTVFGAIGLIMKSIKG